MDFQESLQKDVLNIKKMIESAGLDLFPVNFEVITKKAMIEFGTYALPNRYSHWTFGKSYGKLKNLSNLGVLEILEMVLNSDPATAFLLDSNSQVENRMVIAHVFAHVDFFKHNYWFSKTNRNMINEAKFHERRIHELEYDFGKKNVEEFLDLCLSLQWHVDFYGIFKPDEQDSRVIRPENGKRFFTSSDFQTGPDDITGEEKNNNEEDHNGSGRDTGSRIIISTSPAAPTTPDPAAAPDKNNDDRNPSLDDFDSFRTTVEGEGLEERDILKFLMREAPLDDWQREIIQIVHDEIIYFIPTALTKIMNEGWATYWHTEICRDYLSFEDFNKFAIKHSELMASKGLNPYKVGYLVYNDIQRRWDEEHGEGAGLKKIFEVREFEDDVSFIRNYLTQKICDECGLFLFEQDKTSGEMVITSTNVEDIKESLINELINFGKPLIVVRNADYNGNRELYLLHKFDGRELDMEYAVDVMKAIFNIWNKPVHLETVISEKRSLVTYNGDKPEISTLSQ